MSLNRPAAMYCEADEFNLDLFGDEIFKGLIGRQDS